MDNRIKSCIYAASLFVLSTAAPAAMAYGIYTSASAGISMPPDAETTDSTLPGESIDLGYDNDIVAAGAVGLSNGPYRSEVEVSYQKNDLDSISASGVSVTPSTLGVSGDTRFITGLVNAYYDLDLGHGIKPYITGGLGLSNIRVRFNATGVTPSSVSDDKTVFAYQVGAGIGYQVSQNVTLDVRYRYFSGRHPEFGTTEIKFASHNFMAGVRYSF